MKFRQGEGDKGKRPSRSAYMNRYLIFILLFLVPTGLYAQKESYVIGPSDVLEITVWGEQNLSRQVMVRTDGFISLPLIGEVLASGKVPGKLQNELEKSLKKYIKTPHAAVIVVEPKSKRFYITGEVNHPGMFLIDRDTYLTQAIALAGGFTQWADKSGIVILRYGHNNQTRLELDYKKIIKGKSSDVLISPGDTIIVP